MSNVEVIDTKQELIIRSQEFDVSEETQLSLAEAYKPFLEKAQLWEQQAREIVVTDINDKEGMKKAEGMRKQVKALRIELEKKRKEIKHDAQQKGKAIDTIAREIKAMIEPMEEYLKEQEEFAKREKARIAEQVKAERKAQLDKYEFDTTFIDLGEMDEDNYAKLLQTAKTAHDAKVKAEKEAAEAERKRQEEEAEKERQRVAAEKAEQERIRQEREQLEKELAAERAKAEEERKAREAAEKKRLAEEEKKRAEEQARLDAERKQREAEEQKRREEEATRLEAERKEREKAEAEARRLREAEAKRKAEEQARLKAEEEARQKALQAGDKEKLEMLSEAISLIELPELKSKAAKRVLFNATAFLDQAKDQIATGLTQL